MVKIKDSKQPKLVVVPHDPYRGLRYFGIGLLAAIVSFAVGYSMNGGGDFGAQNDLSDLRRQLLDEQKASAEQHRRLAKFEVESDVDQEANNNVRASIGSMRQQIAELESEISFYKGLMDPSDGNQGISIASVDLRPTSDARKFEFALVLQQRSQEHSIVSGSVNVNVVGSKDGYDLTLPISDLSEDINSSSIEYRFKYFQNIEGTIELPEDYQPRRIDVLVIGSGASSVYLEKKVGWLTGEV